MSKPNTESQVPVKWAVGLHLEDKQTSICQIPVVPLSALRETIKKMSDEAITKMEAGEKSGCSCYFDGLNDLLASLGEQP